MLLVKVVKLLSFSLLYLGIRVQLRLKCQVARIRSRLQFAGIDFQKLPCRLALSRPNPTPGRENASYRPYFYFGIVTFL